jgi:hypothetical protein
MLWVVCQLIAILLAQGVAVAQPAIPPTATTSIPAYDAASNSSVAMVGVAFFSAATLAPAGAPATAARGEASAPPAVFIAVETVPKTIVIGEDMEGRVIPYANKIGADYYSPPEAPPSQWMENNRNWINDRMDEGCRIVDCGAEPGRANYPEPTSPYYQMERGEIAKRDYPYYSRVSIDGP